MRVGIYSSSPQSGKSTVCDLFDDGLFTRVSFADPVKQSLAVVLRALNVAEYDRYLYGDWKEKVIPELGVSGRWLMVAYGTEFFRKDVNQDTWLNCAVNRMSVPGNYVCDDLRFSNEADIFDIVICVVRPSDEGIGTMEGYAEGNLDKYSFDYIITNDGTLEELVQTTRILINTLERLMD